MAAADNTPKPYWHPWLACLAIVGVCFLCFSHIHVLLIDDGFIAHRYAANLVRGFGLVFNQGQRVEGISDLSWVLLMTVPQVFGWRPELFAISIGVISAVAALFIAYRTAVSCLGVPPGFALGVFCVAACNAEYWIAAANGIESGFYALVITSAFALVLHHRLVWAGIALGFATTLRPESLALAPLALACIVFADTRAPFTLQSLWRTLRHNLKLLLPWIVIILGVLIWRISYYGEFLPNTVIAKSHPIHFRDLYFGTKYLFLFSLKAAPWVILPFALFLKRLDLVCALGITWLSYQVVVIMLNGGDWMFGFRLINVFFPILVLISARGLIELVDKFTSFRRGILVAVASVAALAQISDRSWTLRQGILEHHALLELIPSRYEPYYLNIARVLKPALHPSDIIAPEVMGVVSYVLLDNPMHDWLGLVDRYIAHHGTVYFPTFGKADPAYSVNVVGPAVFAFASGISTVEIFQSHTGGVFSNKYACWEVVGQPLILAIRRDREQDLLHALRQANLPVKELILKSSL